MTYRRFRPLLLLVLATLFLSGCVASRIGESWSALTTISLNGQVKILLAETTRVVLVDPANGAHSRLVNPQGEVRVDESGNPRLWRIDGQALEGMQFLAEPLVVDEENLLFPTFNDRLVIADILTARIDSPLGIPVRGGSLAPIVADDENFYVAIKSGGVEAIDRETYASKWYYPTENGVWAAPLLADGVLYIPSIDHHLYAVDAATGEAVWDEPADLEGAIASSPILYDGHIYVGSFSHRLYKISLSGQIVSSYMASNWIWSSPVEYDGLLYITDLSGSAHAVNPGTMTATWATRPATRGIRPAPLVTDEYVIVASRDGMVYWLDRRDGSLVFEREVEGRPEILSDLLLLEENAEAGVPESLVIVGTVDPGQALAAFALTNGRPSWVYRF